MKEKHELDLENQKDEFIELKKNHKEELNNLVIRYEKSIIIHYIMLNLNFIILFLAIKDLKHDKDQIKMKNSLLISAENDEDFDIEVISNKTSSCEIKNCDGSGNINPKFNTHRR